MMGAWQIGRSARDPLDAGALVDGVKELGDALENNGGWHSHIEADEPIDCLVLVSGVVQRGQLILLRIPLVDVEPPETPDA